MGEGCVSAVCLHWTRGANVGGGTMSGVSLSGGSRSRPPLNHPLPPFLKEIRVTPAPLCRFHWEHCKARDVIGYALIHSPADACYAKQFQCPFLDGFRFKNHNKNCLTFYDLSLATINIKMAEILQQRNRYFRSKIVGLSCAEAKIELCRSIKV